MELSLPGRGGEVDLEEIRITPEAGIVGLTIEAIERAEARVRIVALKRGAEPIRVIPDPALAVQAGDHLVVVGARDSLERLGT
jgi:Trk K+ transport system NAD-binding subunit